MPIYEYQCTACQHRMELIQKVNDPAQTRCPNCSKDALVKLVSAAGFQLKGSGWYATDFKNKGSNPESNKTDKQEAANTEGSAKETTSNKDSTKTSETKGDVA
jgi:putative FmdB family regulatory protein